MSIETIAAVATPPGRGGIGIVRISGPHVRVIAEIMLGVLPPARMACFAPFRDSAGGIIDEGIALFFPAPHSYTGEDILELQGHGGPLVMDLLLARTLELGARPARPGEFSERAFLNNKLDLAQAEAVADLIESSTAEAARSAMASLKGVFSQQVHKLVDGLIELRLYVESAIDFPEEEIDFLADEQIGRRLHRLQQQIRELRANAAQGQLLRDGMRIVIIGRPNAGKSSLLNQLAGHEAAIVTAVPGTTRDVLRERISIDGMPLHVIDTAGLRESDDIVEREGMRRTWSEIQTADRILLMIDDRYGFTEEDQALHSQLPPTTSMTIVRNKIDLTAKQPQLQSEARDVTILLSAKTGQGIELLKEHLKACMGYSHSGEDGFMARRRHLQALDQAQTCLESARCQLDIAHAGELAAEELRLAQQALAEITGEFTSDDLLGRIFSSFCIGK